MSQKLEDARAKLKRADRYLKLSIGVFVVFMMIATGVMSYQLYDLQEGLYRQQQRAEAQTKADRQAAQQRLEKALEENARQHKEQKDYFRCMLNALVTPLAYRSSAIFDQCGIETDSQASTSSEQSNQPATAPAPAKTATPATQQATTSSPPDPERATPLSTFVDDLLKPLDVSDASRKP